MSLSQKAVEAAFSAFKACRPVERTACQDFGMQQDDIIRQQLEAALTAALAVDGLCLVPRPDLQRVVDIAGRNEAAPEIDAVRAMVAAASDGDGK